MGRVKGDSEVEGENGDDDGKFWKFGEGMTLERMWMPWGRGW